MHPFFSSIKAVGFDLDRTLYQETPEMSEKIFREMLKAILRFKPELETLENVRTIYGQKLAERNSWAQFFQEIGMKNCQETVSGCLEIANIAELIMKDLKLVEIIKKLSEKYFLFLITKSFQAQAVKKLARIGIKHQWFHFSSFGDSPSALADPGNKNFAYLLSQLVWPASSCVFIGDSVPRDILIPKILGMKTILVGSISPEADFSVSHIHEIENLLLP